MRTLGWAGGCPTRSAPPGLARLGPWLDELAARCAICQQNCNFRVLRPHVSSQSYPVQDTPSGAMTDTSGHVVGKAELMTAQGVETETLRFCWHKAQRAANSSNHVVRRVGTALCFMPTARLLLSAGTNDLRAAGRVRRPLRKAPAQGPCARPRTEPQGGACGGRGPNRSRAARDRPPALRQTTTWGGKGLAQRGPAGGPARPVGPAARPLGPRLRCGARPARRWGRGRT